MEKTTVMKGILLYLDYEWYVQHQFNNKTYLLPLHPDQKQLWSSQSLDSPRLQDGLSVEYDITYDSSKFTQEDYMGEVILLNVSAPTPPPAATPIYNSVIESNSHKATADTYTSPPDDCFTDSDAEAFSEENWDDIFEAAITDNRATMFAFLRYLKEHYKVPARI